MPIISLQVSEDLLDRFEKVRHRAGFSSKSEALRDAIAYFIAAHEKFADKKGYKMVSINLVYPFKDIILDEISEIYSQYQNVIKTITDWRIVEKKVEIVLAVGEIEIIRDLYQKLVGIKDLVCTIQEIIID